MVRKRLVVTSLIVVVLALAAGVFLFLNQNKGIRTFSLGQSAAQGSLELTVKNVSNNNQQRCKR